MSEVLYLHFGRQCPGDYMEVQARRAAELLSRPFRVVDITHRPELAEKHNVFFPGAIVIDDLVLVYPGSPEQIVESYRLNGPLPGVTRYEPKSQGQVERLEPLTAENVGIAATSCIPSLAAECATRKAEWLRSLSSDGFCGVVGYVGDRMVGYVEILPEDIIPYPIGKKSQRRAFVTCLYSPIEWGSELDYRQSLMAGLMAMLPQHGYDGISIISGVNTPYPNGPEALLSPLGFKRVKHMGKAVLRNCYEDAHLLRRFLP